MAKVSVIVPNYNHAKFLTQRMESILAQTFRDFEIIILDDCSTDNSRELIETYRGHEKLASIILNEKNSGSTFLQWEKGITASSGTYIWIAESDDFCDVNFLETAVAKLENGYDLFYARTISVDETGMPRELKSLWTDDISTTRWNADFENNAPGEVKEMLFLKNTIPNASAVVFKRTGKLASYLEEIKGMRYCGDWIFWMLYLLDAQRLYYSVSTQNYFRTHPSVSRLSHSKKDRNKEVLKVLRFVLKNPLSSGKHGFLVTYYFETHLYKSEKRNISSNFKSAIKQAMHSPRFISSWVRYYLR
ncbi:MAG: glycosyltransferase family 2 protein [Bacteroidia bacterium]